MKTTSKSMMAVVLLTSLSASAQTRIGFTAGTTFSNLKEKSGEVSVTYDYKPGFTAGVFVNVPFNSNFSFRPALNFVQKGGSFKEGSFSDKISLNYLEHAINFVYSAQKSKGFFVGAGHAIAYGISGKDKWSDGTTSGDEEIKFGSDDDKVKHFEISANLFAGYQFANGLMFSGGYNLGLSNMSHGDSEDSKTKSSYFSAKLGWMLPHKRG